MMKADNNNSISHYIIPMNDDDNLKHSNYLNNPLAHNINNYIDSVFVSNATERKSDSSTLIQQLDTLIKNSKSYTDNAIK